MRRVTVRLPTISDRLECVERWIVLLAQLRSVQQGEGAMHTPQGGFLGKGVLVKPLELAKRFPDVAYER